MGLNVLRTSTGDLSIVHSYRHLYRALLRAVQFSKPNRYTARDQLRDAFRRGDPAKFDPVKISRTLDFLHGAARETGMEHKILKNLLHTDYARRARMKKYLKSKIIIKREPNTIP